MKSRFFLNIVVGEGAAILELLAGEDQALLVRRDAFFVLDLRFYIVDGVAGLDFEGYGLTRSEIRLIRRFVEIGSLAH